MNFFKLRSVLIAILMGNCAFLYSEENASAKTVTSEDVSLKAQDAKASKAKKEELEAVRQERLKSLDAAEKERSANLNKKLDENKKITERKYSSEFFQSFSGAPVLTADNPIDYNTDSGRLLAEKNATLATENFEIKADKIEFFGKEDKADAEGNVAVSMTNYRVVADSFDVETQKSKLTGKNVRFGSFPLYAETGEASGSKEKITAKEAVLYYGEPDIFSLNLKVANLEYDAVEDYVGFEDMFLRFGPVPVFYIPAFGQHGLDAPPIIFENVIEYSSDFGFYIQNTVLYTGLGPFHVGGLLDYYDKRGVLFGPALNIKYYSENISSVGYLRAGYISDRGGADLLGKDSYGVPIEQDRFFIELKNNTKIYDRFNIISSLSYWSDEFVTRDFREKMYYPDQHPDNFVEALYRGDFYSASVFTRFQPNEWEREVQRLPELRVDVADMKLLNTGIYHNGYASYGYYKETSYAGVSDAMSTDRFDAYYGISRPIFFNSWSSFTPLAGVRLTHYGETANGGSEYTRVLGQVGFDAEMNAWGVWETRSKTMGIDGVRHNFRPVMKYRYIPSADQGASKIYPMDTTEFNAYPPTLDLGLARNVDRLYNTNTLRFGIENVFQTRDGSYGSREIARLDMYQDINFSKYPYEGDPNRKSSYSDFYTNLSVSPARWLSFGIYNRVNTNDGTWAEASAYVELKDMDAWRIVLGNIYLDSLNLKQYYVLADVRLSERYSLSGAWYYDGDLAKMTYQVYSLKQRLGNSWIIEYYISNRSGATRNDNASVGIRVNLLTY